jgi:hypothetical protein
MRSVAEAGDIRERSTPGEADFCRCGGPLVPPRSLGRRRCLFCRRPEPRRVVVVADFTRGRRR